MALQDDAQNTWDKVKDGFNERIGSDDSMADDSLAPEDQERLGEDMSSIENDPILDDGLADPIEDEGVREYTDEDRA